MTLSFLGTGTSQGVPVVTCNCPVCLSNNPRDCRLRSSVLVKTDLGSSILIDIGPDFRYQMLREGINHIDAILITHAHRDHVAGIDDIRPFNYTQQSKIKLYTNRLASDILQHDYGYIFDSHIYPGLPEVDLITVSGDTSFDVARQNVIPVKAMHKDMPILGFRLDKLAYITDANYIEDSELTKLSGVDVLVINALCQEKHFSHFSLQESLQIIEKIAPAKAYITHVSHKMGLYDEVEHILPKDVHLAYDGLHLNI